MEQDEEVASPVPQLQAAMFLARTKQRKRQPNTPKIRLLRDKVAAAKPDGSIFLVLTGYGHWSGLGLGLVGQVLEGQVQVGQVLIGQVLVGQVLVGQELVGRNLPHATWQTARVQQALRTSWWTSARLRQASTPAIATARTWIVVG